MNLQLFVTIPRIIEAFLLITILIAINSKYSKVPFIQRPLLHRLFVLGIGAWWAYILIDNVLYIVAPLSFDLNSDLSIIGYDINYPSLFVANIIRDFAFLGLFGQIWCYFFASCSISKGELKTRSLMKNPLLWMPYIALTIYSTVIDKIAVQIDGGILIVGTIGDTFTSYAKYLIPMILYSIAAIYLRKTLDNTLIDNDSQIMRTQILQLNRGIILLSISYAWYLIMRTIGVITNLYNIPSYYLLVSLVLHMFWIMDPMFIYLGLKPIDKP